MNTWDQYNSLFVSFFINLPDFANIRIVNLVYAFHLLSVVNQMYYSLHIHHNFS